MATYFFHSGMVGAPANTNAAGSTLAIIRACLATGFNLKTPQTATVASGVMTLTYSAPHGYEDRVWIRLDGAPGGSLVQRCTTSAGASTLTIPAPGFADGPVTGALSTRVAPADWEEVFTGTLKAVFRSKVEGPGSTRFFYRVADAVSGNTCRMRGFESMTDVDVGLGLFPSLAQASGDGVDVRRAESGWGVLPWAAVCDGRTVYLTLGRYGAAPFASLCFFGDEQRVGSADGFCAFIGAGDAQYSTSTYFRPRNAAGTTTSQIAAAPWPNWRGSYMPYPASVELGGGITLNRPVLGFDGTAASSGIRSVLRGAIAPTANPVPAGTIYFVMNNVTGIDGRVVFLRAGADSFPSVIAFSIDEEWP